MAVRSFSFNLGNKSDISSAKKLISNIFNEFSGKKKNYITTGLNRRDLITVAERIARTIIPSETTYEYRKSQAEIDQKESLLRTQSELDQQGPADGVLQNSPFRVYDLKKSDSALAFRISHIHSSTVRGDDDFSRVLHWIDQGRKESPSIDQLLTRNKRASFLIQGRADPIGVRYRQNVDSNNQFAVQLNEFARAMFEVSHERQEPYNFISIIKTSMEKFIVKDLAGKILNSAIAKK